MRIRHTKKIKTLKDRDILGKKVILLLSLPLFAPSLGTGFTFGRFIASIENNLVLTFYINLNELWGKQVNNSHVEGAIGNARFVSTAVVINSVSCL